jgi:hypothetical protein
MQTYRFSLIVEGELTESSDQQLFEAGNGDTTASANNGIWQLHFVRESECLESAIVSVRNQIMACGLQVSELVMNTDALNRVHNAVAARGALTEYVPVGP